MYGIDGRQMMEIEVLAPEAKVGLQFRGGSRVQSTVQADLAEVSFLRWHAFRLEQPDLQGIIRSSCLLRVRLNGFPQAVFNIQRTMINRANYLCLLKLKISNKGNCQHKYLQPNILNTCLSLKDRRYEKIQFFAQNRNFTKYTSNVFFNGIRLLRRNPP